MIILEFDLAGAEWVVVAYLAQDQNMLNVVRSGKSPHVVTGSLISGATEEFVLEENKVIGSNTDANTIATLRSRMTIPPGIFLPRVMSIRQAGKKSNHGLNYNMKYRRFALENEMPEDDAKPMVEAYLDKAYPGIKRTYWAAVQHEMRKNNRTLVNCFGRKVRLLSEWGEELFNQAYSFKPQSTVVDICNKAMILCYEDQSPYFEHMFLGAQVHDSLHIQTYVPQHKLEWYNLAKMCWKISQEYMRPEIEYGGTKFRLGCDMKLGLNWGDMFPVKIESDPAVFVASIQKSYDDAVLKADSYLVESEVEGEEELERPAQDHQRQPSPALLQASGEPEPSM